MDKLTKAADRVIEGSRRESSRRVATTAAALVKFTADNLPLSFDHGVDVALPARLWSAWTPENGKRTIRREMTSAERDMTQRRVNALEPALAPFRRPQEDERVQTAIDGLFASYSSVRLSGEAYLARIHSFVMTLEDMPAWAIEQACVTIRKRGYEVIEGDKRRIEQGWAPSEAQLHAAVESVVSQRRNALVSAKALLAAPVEPKAPEPSGPSVEASLAEFKQATGEDALDDAEAKRRKLILEKKRAEDLRQRTREYAAAGLMPPVPVNGVISSLPMMLKYGWTIQGSVGQRVLVEPTKEEEEADAE